MKKFNELYESILSEGLFGKKMSYEKALKVREKFQPFNDKLDKALAKTQYIANENLVIDEWAKKIGCKRSEFDAFLDANRAIQDEEYEVMDYIRTDDKSGDYFHIQDPEDN